MRLVLDDPVREWLDGRMRGRRVRVAARWIGRALWLAPLVVLVIVAWRLLEEPEPPAVPPPRPGQVFGLSDEERREVWVELMRGDASRWKRARERFPGHAWSQQDDYTHILTDHLLEIARRRDLPFSIVYLVLDEGIRNRWPGPDGGPLDASPVPLRPRLR